MEIFYQLARNTSKECLRGPVYFLILITALVMIGLFPSLTMFVFRNQVRMVVDSSMAVTMMSGLFVAVLCAGHTINREMKNGTVLLLMSKPITRFTYVLSKMSGILISLTAFLLICCSATCATVEIAVDEFAIDYTVMTAYFSVLQISLLFGAQRNYFAQKSFSANFVLSAQILYPLLAAVLILLRANHADADGHITGSSIQPGLLIPALVMLFPSVWLMGIISSAFAIRVDFVVNLLLCLSVFLLGLISQYIVTNFLGDSFFANCVGSIVPNWQFFWMADALVNQARIPFSYVALSMLYFLFYGTICFVWALFLFQDVELAKDNR